MASKINEVCTVLLQGYNNSYAFPEEWLEKMAKDFYSVELNKFLNSYDYDDAELLNFAFMEE